MSYPKVISSTAIETIRVMYHGQKTTNQICAAVKLTPEQLRHVLEVCGIYQETSKRLEMGSRLTDADRDKLRRIYLETKSVPQVATALGITESGAYYNLRKMGLINGRWPKKVGA